MAKNNFEELLENASTKHNGRKGGGKNASVIGLWAGKGGVDIKTQRHISVKALGVKDGEKMVFTIEDNKIIINILNDEQAKAFEKAGKNVFSASTHGKYEDGTAKYQNYVVVAGLDDETWQKMIEINGGLCKHKKSEKEFYNRYVVKRWDNKQQ